MINTRFPARTDVSPQVDFSLHFFGIADKQVHAFWRVLEELPRRAPDWTRVEFRPTTRVRVTEGFDQGLVGVVDACNGDDRRVCGEQMWAWVPMCWLEEIK